MNTPLPPALPRDVAGSPARYGRAPTQSLRVRVLASGTSSWRTREWVFEGRVDRDPATAIGPRDPGEVDEMAPASWRIGTRAAASHRLGWGSIMTSARPVATRMWPKQSPQPRVRRQVLVAPLHRLESSDRLPGPQRREAQERLGQVRAGRDPAPRRGGRVPPPPGSFAPGSHRRLLFCAGRPQTPATDSPSNSSPISVPKSGTRATNDFVPSTGSRTHRYPLVPARSPNSSPRMPSSGNSLDRKSRRSSSAPLARRP